MQLQQFVIERSTANPAFTTRFRRPPVICSQFPFTALLYHPNKFHISWKVCCYLMEAFANTNSGGCCSEVSVYFVFVVLFEKITNVDYSACGEDTGKFAFHILRHSHLPKLITAVFYCVCSFERETVKYKKSPMGSACLEDSGKLSLNILGHSHLPKTNKISISCLQLCKREC